MSVFLSRGVALLLGTLASFVLALVSCGDREAAAPQIAADRVFLSGAEDLEAKALRGLRAAELVAGDRVLHSPVAADALDRVHHRQQRKRGTVLARRSGHRIDELGTREGARTVMHEGMPWSAHLEVFSVDDAWRGFIRFDEGAAGRATRTADIFAEARVDMVRDRFVGFHDQTLQAFLRSTLP